MEVTKNKIKDKCIHFTLTIRLISLPGFPLIIEPCARQLSQGFPEPEEGQ